MILDLLSSLKAMKTGLNLPYNVNYTKIPSYLLKVEQVKSWKGHSCMT